MTYPFLVSRLVTLLDIDTQPIAMILCGHEPDAEVSITFPFVSELLDQSSKVFQRYIN